MTRRHLKCETRGCRNDAARACGSCKRLLCDACTLESADRQHCTCETCAPAGSRRMVPKQGRLVR